MHKHDITTTEDIKLLVDTFYAKVLADPLIAHIFINVAHISLEHHMPIMYLFWGTMLLQTGAYRDNPMAKHMQLDKKTELKPEHFERWLQLWEQNVNEHFAGELATQAIIRAKNIASLMEMKVKQVR